MDENKILILSEYEKELNNQKYLLKIILYSSEKLEIRIYNPYSNKNVCHNKLFNIKQLKELSKSFEIYDSLEKIFDCIKNILDNGKGSILLKEENVILSLNAFMPDGNKNIINFELNQNSLNKDEIIQALSERIIQLDNKLETMNKNQNNIINDLKKRLELLEEKERKREEKEKEKIEKEKLIIRDILNSSICRKEEIEFFEEEFKKHNEFYNKSIRFKLLYKATRDGQGIKIFHSRCDNRNSTLILISSKNGSRFGGYTQHGFNETDDEAQDDNAFVFSLNKMQIYPVKKGEISIYCKSHLYGFKDTIYIYDNCLTSYSIQNIGGSKNYPTQNNELNNNEQNFFCSEVEAYQIIGI